MRTPYTGGQKTCIQKFGNAYQRNRKKHLYHHHTIQRNTEMLFINDVHFPFTMLACLLWSFTSWLRSLGCVETESCFLRTMYASLPWSCIRLDFYAHYMQKFALMRPLNIDPCLVLTDLLTLSAMISIWEGMGLVMKMTVWTWLGGSPWILIHA